MKPKQHWSLKTAVEQLARCGYECEAGPLFLNDAYLWLKGVLEKGLEYMPGQGVWYEVSGEVAGKTMQEWRHYYIVACSMTSGEESAWWIYHLSDDPPGPWHCGEIQIRNIRADSLRLERPESEGE